MNKQAQLNRDLDRNATLQLIWTWNYHYSEHDTPDECVAMLKALQAEAQDLQAQLETETDNG